MTGAGSVTGAPHIPLGIPQAARRVRAISSGVSSRRAAKCPMACGVRRSRYSAVGGVTHGVPLRHDDPRGDPRHDELGGQGQVSGAERVDRVVSGDDVQRGGEGAGAGAELVAGGDADVHGDRAGEGIAEVQDAGDPAAVGEQVIAVEVGMDDLRRRHGQHRADHGVEPVEAVLKCGTQPARRNAAAIAGGLRDLRQQAAAWQLVEQRPELPEVLQVPQVGPPRARVAQPAQRDVKPGERRADIPAQRGVGRAPAEQLPVEPRGHPDQPRGPLAGGDQRLGRPVKRGRDPLYGQLRGGGREVQQDGCLEGDLAGGGAGHADLEQL